MTGGYNDGVDLERFDVDGVDFHHREKMASDFKKELFIKCSID